MTLTFQGRVEAMATVPTGGAAVSVATGLMAGAATATVAADDYYLTAAGGVNSLIDDFETALNAACPSAPQTAAATASAIAYGTWSAGWAFDIASGNDTGLFGGVTMTAAGTPVYRNAGPGSASDYAISFDSNTDAFTAGDNFDVDAASDMAWAWVANFGTSTTVANFLSKGIAGVGEGRLIVYTDSGNVIFQAFRTSDGTSIATCTLSASAAFVDAWHVGIATIDRATGKMRVGIQMLAAGTQYIGTEQTIAASDLSSSGNFTVGVQNIAITPGFKMAALYVAAGASKATGLSANIATALTNFANVINSRFSVSLSTTDGRVTIAHSIWSYSLTWTSTDLRDLFGFTGNISSVVSATGTKQAKGLVFFDCPLNADTDPYIAPLATDKRGTESPTGNVISLVGNSKYRMRNLVWSHVPKDRIWETYATYSNASYEQWLKDTQLGQGHAWFSTGSRVQVWWDRSGVQTLVGQAAASGVGLTGWFIKGLDSIEPRLSQDGYAGLYRVEWQELISDG